MTVHDMELPKATVGDADNPDIPTPDFDFVGTTHAVLHPTTSTEASRQSDNRDARSWGRRVMNQALKMIRFSFTG